MTSGSTTRSNNSPRRLFSVARSAATTGRHSLAGVLLSVGLAISAAAAGPSATVDAEHGMVVSAHRLASEAGLRMLVAGGNAIDAAVAVGYALAVVDPCCGNIGGGGFMTIHLADGRETFINFRETAPAAASAAMYLDRDSKPIDDLSRYGYRAAGVPGTVMGLDRAAAEYGRLPRAASLAPAIALARDGFALSRADTEILDGKADKFGKDPAAAKIFLRPDGSRFEPGDRLVQTELASTLGLIVQQGPNAFYKGVIAAAVDNASNARGGILTAQDFAAYTVTESAPLTCSYHSYVIFSAPPPSSGGATMCEILNILEGHEIGSAGARSAQWAKFLIEAMRRGYRDRNTYLGDPSFVANPLERLLSKDYAGSLRKEIERGPYPNPLPLAGEGTHEKSETTHYSVVDDDGNAVAVTYTLNASFGANVIAPGTGFFLNDEMDDFAVKPGAPNLYGLVQGEPNAIAPRKRPLSSMSPTLVEKDGKVVFVLGSPGGARIISTVLETILNLIDFGMVPRQAVDAPRLHHQWQPDEVYLEKSEWPTELIKALTESGYRTVEQRPWGAVELIEIGDGRLVGVSDGRRPAGAAIGY